MLDKTAAGVVYQGGDGQAIFPIPFPFLESSHIVAIRRDAEARETVLAPGHEYAVARVSEEYGEVILLGDTLAAGECLVISRRVPLTQEILFHNQGPNSPRAMEEAVDKLTMIAQQLRDDLEERPTRKEGTGAADAVAHLTQSLQTVRVDLADKADRTHSHAMAALDGLAEALAGKADVSELQSRLASVQNSLAAKVEKSDPRLARVDAHAARHAAAGPDRILPADLGVLPAPPADGKAYLAAAGGWIEYLPPTGTGDGGGDGGTADHAQLLNRDAADQHPQSAIQHLPGDLNVIRAALGELGCDLAAVREELAEKANAGDLPPLASASAAGLLSSADKNKLDGLDAVIADLDSRATALAAGVADAASGTAGLAGTAAALEERIGALESGLAGLGSMAGSADAPADGKQYARKNGVWVEVAASGGASGGNAIVGEIRLLPFRRANLPSGWYFCNGDQYSLSSPQGAALSSLPAAMKSDWGIAVSGSNISLPNLFSGADGYFLRPVNNAARQPGDKQTDAMRNITGSFSNTPTTGMAVKNVTVGDSVATGAFTIGTFNKNYSPNTYSYGPNSGANLEFDASRSVPTANENRPVNIGMTPAIYLGA